MKHNREKAMHFLSIPFLVAFLSVSICYSASATYDHSYKTLNSGIIKFLPSIHTSTNNTFALSISISTNNSNGSKIDPKVQVIEGKPSHNLKSQNITGQKVQVIEGKPSKESSATNMQTCAFYIPSTYLDPRCVQELFSNPHLSSFIMTAFPQNSSAGVKTISSIGTKAYNSTGPGMQVISSNTPVNYNGGNGDVQFFGGKSSGNVAGNSGIQTFGGKVSGNGAGYPGYKFFGGKVLSGGKSSTSSTSRVGSQGTQIFGGEAWSPDGNNAEHPTSYTISGSPTASNNLTNAETQTQTSMDATNKETGRDTLLPVIVSIDPSDNAREVSVNYHIDVKFSEAMDSSTVTSDTITVKKDASSVDTPVAGKVQLMADGKTANFQPLSNFDFDSHYIIQVSTKVKDLQGNSLSSGRVWSFTTESSPYNSESDSIIVTKLKLDPIDDIPWGSAMKVTGKLVFDDSSSNSVHAGQVITFSGTGTSLIPNAITKSDGSFASIGSAPAKVSTGWTVQAHFSGSSQYSKRESPIATYSTKEHPTSLTLDVFPITKANTKSIIENYKLSGVLKDKITSTTLDGKTIIFTSNSPMKLSPEKTDTKGKYIVSGSVSSTAYSTYVFKARFNGDSRYESADSLKHTISEKINDAGTEKPQDSSRTVSDDSSQGAFPTGSNGEKKNHKPIAVASADKIVKEGSTVRIFGSKSTDSDRDKLTYSWSQKSGPLVVLNNRQASNAAFMSPSVEKDTILIFKLTVDDGKPNGKASDFVKIIVNDADDNTLSGEGIYHHEVIDQGEDKNAQAQSQIGGSPVLGEKASGHAKNSIENSQGDLTT